MNEDGPKPKKRGRPRRMERDKVLNSAMEHYWRDGVHALSLNEVCRRISVSKPSVYREFGSEDGLVDAVLGYYKDAVVTPVLAFTQGDRPFFETLETLIVAMTTLGEHPPGCLFTEMRLLRDGLGPQTRARLDDIEEERRVIFESVYARALDQGEVNPSMSAEVASRFLDAQFSMVLLHMGMGQEPPMVQQHARLALEVLRPPG